MQIGANFVMGGTPTPSFLPSPTNDKTRWEKVELESYVDSTYWELKVQKLFFEGVAYSHRQFCWFLSFSPTYG